MNVIKKNIISGFCILLYTVCLFSVSSISGKTRWSSLHIVPDADLFGSGEFTIGFDGYIAKGMDGAVLFKPSGPIKFGITEWVNLDVAYSGGMTLGLKSRILGETEGFMPSLAIGVHNLFNHKEINYFSASNANDMNGEVYLAMSKSVERIKTRFHLGIQSIPKSDKDEINPYCAVEKYFGLGLYSSLEFYRRQEKFHLSLFANWRFFNNHLEISLGAVELKSMFFDENDKFSVSLAPNDSNDFVKPGLWVGIKFRARFGLGSNKGFMSIEDRFRRQDETVKILVEEVDSLNGRMKETLATLKSVQSSLGMLIDSIENDPTKIKNIIFNKLITLKTLYSSEPFDPNEAKRLIGEIASFREKAVPSLEELLLDIKVDRYVRTYSAAMLGEIGNSASSDVLLNVLAQTNDPDVKIEILIALGKMKETRAMYLMEQLANSPNDAIAITAQDVLLRLSEETGAEISPGLKMRQIAINEERKLIEKKKGIIQASSIRPDTGKSAPDIPKKSEVAKEDTSAIDTSKGERKMEAASEEEDIKTGAKDTVAVDKQVETKIDVKVPKEDTIVSTKPEESKVSKEVKDTVSAEIKEKIDSDSAKKDKKEEIKEETDKEVKKEESDKRKKRKDRRKEMKKDKKEDKKEDKEEDKKESRKERDKNW